MRNYSRQRGSALITILIIVMVMVIIGAISVKSGLLSLKIATNSQAVHIMNQNTDAAYLKSQTIYLVQDCLDIQKWIQIVVKN